MGPQDARDLQEDLVQDVSKLKVIAQEEHLGVRKSEFQQMMSEMDSAGISCAREPHVETRNPLQVLEEKHDDVTYEALQKILYQEFFQPAEVYKQKAVSYVRAGQNEEALKCYTSLISDDSLMLSRMELAELYYKRATVQAKMFKGEIAILDYTRAIKLNPKFVQALRGRAKLYEELHNHSKAFDDYKKLSCLEPEDYEIKNALHAISKKIKEDYGDFKKRLIVSWGKLPLECFPWQSVSDVQP